ncbi:MAG TPA: phosphatase PAP2 family protein [Xanthomonadaceae bacterium]|nr:phosphatase PAP2 family protein [Xanthomonadaceae bacterium]
MKLHSSETIWCGCFLIMGSIAAVARNGELSLWLIGLALAVVVLGRLLPLRWRLFLGLCWINCAYVLGSDVAKAARMTRYDDVLLRADALLGWHAGGWIPAPLTLDVLSCFYVSFYVLIVAGICLFLRRPAFYTGFALIYALGTLCYVIVPAAGPFFDWPLASAGTHVYVVLQSYARQLVTGVDVFPSLHVAASCYVLAWLIWRWQRAWLACALWACGIALATVGLRYHYLVDVFAALILTGVVLATLQRHDAFKRTPELSETPVDPQPHA